MPEKPFINGCKLIGYPNVKRITKGLFYILVAFIFLSLPAFSKSNEGDTETGWIRAIINKLEVSDYFLTTDPEGNLLITGCFMNKVMFGSKPLVAVGNFDIFVAKYNRNGELLWVQQAGGQGFDMANTIRADTLGNIYIKGYFSGTSFFENYIVKSRAKRNAFMAKYDPKGKLQWIQADGAEIYSEVNPAKRKKILGD
jgi:hypothetical protein